ncbi:MULTISPECIES: hypothetical protein [unclassified Frankia]
MRTPHLLRRFPFRRLAVAPAAAVVVGLGLSGCERPTPLVTMESGGHFVQTNAAQYEWDGTVIQKSVSPPHITVRPGNAINIDVPTSVADRGYFLVLGRERVTDKINETHYRYVPAKNTPALLVVFALPEAGSSSDQASGSWPFLVTFKP